MPKYSDREFLEAIKERLKTKGWQTGSLGTESGPNCILGAAGWVGNEGFRTDERGNHFYVNDEEVDEYDAVPGVVRLARVLGMSVICGTSTMVTRT